MTYQVLARKWRPQKFSSLVGQEHVVRPLTNALLQNRLHHAYLFTGTRGVGKTTVARIFAKALNCEQGVTADPCGICGMCQAVEQGRCVDLIEVDAASRTKVEDTRELLENVQYLPTQGRFKVYLIDEVHMLSGHSFNALLKTLEEPPDHVKFLLATTDPQRLPMTVLSRCLQFHLKNLSPERIVGHLCEVLNQEIIPYEDPALWLIAKAGQGSMRDALSLLDQAIGYGNGHIVVADTRAMLGLIEQDYVINILQALLEQNASALMSEVARIAERSGDYAALLEQLIIYLHQLSLIQNAPEAIDKTPDTQILFTYAQQISAENLQLYYQIALYGRKDLPLAPEARLGFEMTLLRMLAFNPISQGAQPHKATTPLQSLTTKSVETKSAPFPPPLAQSPLKRPAAKPEIKLSEPLASKPILASQETTVLINSKNWPDIVKQLNLSGFTAMLAAHCEVIETIGESLQLGLAPKHAPLLSDPAVKQIEQKLSQYLGKSTHVMIKLMELSGETPMQQAQRLQQDRYEQTVVSLHQDKNIQALVEELGVKIDESSIKLID